MVFNATYNPPVAARTSRPRSNAYVIEPGPTLMVAEPATPYGEGGDNHVR